MYKIHEIMVGESALGGVVSFALSPGLRKEVVGAGGRQYRSLARVADKIPTVRFSTLSIGQANTRLGLAGYNLATAALVLYMAEAEQGGTIKANGVKLTLSNGIVVPVSIAAGLGELAVIEYAAFLGGAAEDAAPYSVAVDQAIPTGVGVTEAYTLDGATLNGTTLGPAKRWDLSMNYDVVQEMGDGSLYPVRVFWRDMNPEVRVGSVNAALVNSLALTGSSNAVVAQLAKVVQGGVHVAAGGLDLTTSQGLTTLDGVGGSHGSEAEADLHVSTSYNGTNLPVTASVRA